MIRITPENFIPGMSLQSPDKVTLTDGRQFICTTLNRLWSIMYVEAHPFYKQLEAPRKSYTIINGPDHGQTLDTPTIVEEGQTIIIRAPGLSRKDLSKDMPMGYSNPLFMRRYHILGDYAYYIGEEISNSPFVGKAERVLDPIAAKMNAESEGGIDVPN